MAFNNRLELSANVIRNKQETVENASHWIWFKRSVIRGMREMKLGNDI
jgi:hypothetical protein